MELWWLNDSFQPGYCFFWFFLAKWLKVCTEMWVHFSFLDVKVVLGVQEATSLTSSVKMLQKGWRKFTCSPRLHWPQPPLGSLLLANQHPPPKTKTVSSACVLSLYRLFIKRLFFFLIKKNTHLHRIYIIHCRAHFVMRWWCCSDDVALVPKMHNGPLHS